MFVNDNIQGYGQMTYSNGDKYEGDFMNGMKHGKGSIVYYNGDQYHG